MQVRVGSTDRALLHGLTARTDGLSVILFPSPVRKACGEEFVNRTKLHTHHCQRMRSVWPTNGPMSGALSPRPGGPTGGQRHAGPPGSGGTAKSPPAEAVLAVGEGNSGVPALAVLSGADVVASAVGFAVCGQLRRPCGRSCAHHGN